MNDIITNLMVKYEDSFIMYLINNTTLNELGDWLIGFFVIYFGIKVLNFLINLTIVTSKHFTKRYKLYEKMDMKDMYWKDFLDRAHRRNGTSIKKYNPETFKF
jgi:hypothetical protein